MISRLGSIHVTSLTPGVSRSRGLLVSVLSGGQGNLEIVPLGVDGGHSAYCAPGSIEHASSAALPPEPLILPTCQSVGDTQTADSSLLVGAASQLNKGDGHAGSGKLCSGSALPGELM